MGTKGVRGYGRARFPRERVYFVLQLPLSAVDMKFASILCVGAPGDDATECTARIHSIVEVFKLELNNFHERREARNADRQWTRALTVDFDKQDLTSFT